jgi:hypothetical protein
MFATRTGPSGGSLGGWRRHPAAGTAQTAPQFVHLTLNFLELPLITHQGSFHRRTIKLQSHELDYKFFKYS